MYRTALKTSSYIQHPTTLHAETTLPVSFPPNQTPKPLRKKHCTPLYNSQAAPLLPLPSTVTSIFFPSVGFSVVETGDERPASIGFPRREHLTIADARSQTLNVRLTDGHTKAHLVKNRFEDAHKV